VKRILLDTNIILDLLAMREPYYDEASKLFSLADKRKVALSISSLSLVNTHYILRRSLAEKETRKILRNFKLLVKVLSLDDKILDFALNSDLKDFEDAIQYFTSIETGQELIITRNMSSFRNSTIPVMTAREFLKSIKT
jgi:predicted nucleic acid-binding protein